MTDSRVTVHRKDRTILIELDLSGGNDWLGRVAKPSEALLEAVAELHASKPQSVTLSARVSSQEKGEDSLAEAAKEMVRGVAGSAALEFADFGCRVNTVVSSQASQESDVAAVVDYFQDDGDAGFTTGAMIDVSHPGALPPEPAEAVALVTGGAGGLGRAAAERLTRDGYRVVISDLPGDQLDQAAEELGIEAIGANLSDEDELKQLVNNRSLDGVNALFLHHGVGASSRLDANFDAEAARRSVSINGTSVWRTFDYLLPALERSGNATVVMLSSVAGLQAEPGNGAYGAAKFAVVGFVKGNYARLSRVGIRLHALCPGPIDTPLMRSIFAGFARDLGITPEEFTAERLGGIPLKRSGQPLHIGAAAGLLARVSAPGIVLAPTGGEVLT